MDLIRFGAFGLGSMLIGFGAMALLYITMVVIGIVTAPDESRTVNWLASQTKENELVMSGRFDEHSFDFQSSPVLQNLGFAILGLFLLSLVSSIVRAVIATGVGLVKLSRSGNRAEAELTKSISPRPPAVGATSHSD